jgi:hypothetical protein
MNTETQSGNLSYAISRDIILEVLDILIYAGLNYEITEIKGNQSLALFNILRVGDTKFQQEAIKNIDGIIRDYDFFRRQEQDKVMWREK